jgi:serine phosphatase RsbU (regulator of sigma subunit)
MSGVPLVVGDNLIGVLHVGTLQHRDFTGDDLAILQMTGERIAHAIYAEQITTDRSTAWTLQRSLLPGRLPDVDGMEFASRFVPAGSARVGGDWFDAFVLPDERLGIVMGDVVGSGLRAAVIMGRLRSALRSYALEFPDPAAVLDRLNRKIMHFEPGQMATVLYLVVDADRTVITLASAGHPPPVGAQPAQEADFLDCRPSPPIGVDRTTAHVTVSHPLEPGFTVAAYTDGLFERRTAPLDTQLDRLRRSVHAGPPQLVASDVMDEMIGTHVVEDDTALLVFRRTP